MKNVELQVAEKSLSMRVDKEDYSFRLSLGFKYLLELLRHPGKRYYAMNLYNAQNPIPEEYRLIAQQTEEERRKSQLYSMDDLPPLYKADWQTVREVGRRLNFLIAQKALCLEYSDLAGLEDIECEMDFLSRYLNDVMRKDGKLSSFASSEKKVVRAVNRAIKRAISEIAGVLPELAAHLEKQVYAWHLLYYLPGGDFQISFG